MAELPDDRTVATTKVRLRDFSRSLPMSLLRTREAVMRHFRASLRHFELTEQQWRVLRALSSVKETEINDLVRSTHLLAPSLSRILRDLDARGLIVRRAQESDLRRALIAISPTGVALMEQVAPLSEAIYAEITRRFGAERLAALQAMLGELEAEMNAYASESLPGDLDE